MSNKNLFTYFITFGLLILLSGCDGTSQETGEVRTYYIAADPVVWNYAPEGMNMITGEEFSGDDLLRTERGDYYIGTEYKKALYREYTDETFTELKPRNEDWEHLGFMGPLIRAEVGDTIRIVFKNNVHFPTSMHPHGVFYEKDSEGAPYNDGTGDDQKVDDYVQPGETHTYTWNVPERAGPPPGGLSSAFWMYHSHSDEFRDVNSGLIAPMIITARGMAGADLRPTDLDREFVIAFMSTEEAASWYIEENVATYMGKPEDITYRRGQFLGRIVVTPEGGSLVNHDAMNGFIYGNMPMPQMKVGERVRWYIMAGTNFELHAPHWHGNVLTAGSMRLDVMELVTMGMQVADMVPDD
ncbi:MAG: multicopper oxidase domain-containing protein, partial [Sphingomonadales bacterium]